MKLQHPFIQLPVAFDASALAAEVAAIDESEWIPHPQGFPGNSALPLISVNGDVQSDGVEGPMRPTALLARLPYMRQVLGRLGAVLGRTRLMRLSGNAEVTPHIDQGYYWAERMRVHVPVVTTPGVRFYCGDANINMAEGECWIFDTWRVHRVHNDAEHARIHLVLDTIGGDGLSELITHGRPHHVRPPAWKAVLFAPGAEGEPKLAFESFNLPRVMSPWELRSHIGFLFTESLPHPNMPAMQQASMRFLRRWQALWAEHGDTEGSRGFYEPVLEEYLADVRRFGKEIQLRNEVSLAGAMQAMVTKAALSGGIFAPQRPPRARGAPALAHRDPEFDRPVFIVSPPRSGSTFLFETLMQAANVFTIGDESHGLIEGIDALNPSLQGFVSNRLDGAAATPMVSAQIRSRFRAALVDRDGGQPYGAPLRMLEKTPKNSLRVPFLANVFPEAQFIYLHRDVREVLASMIEAWSSGGFNTYRQLPGWSGPPWSLLLVPGWRELEGRPLHEIVAAQWQATLRILLDDLAALPNACVHVAHYAALRADPSAEIERLCNAVDFVWDRPPAANLPLSRYTLTKPDADKWRKHQREIEAMLPQLQETIALAERFAAH